MGEGFYEILSGHNRATAANKAGLESVPCVIKIGLTEDDALFVVTETNLLQRSFGEFTHKERAESISMLHKACKRQGRRSDLFGEVDAQPESQKSSARGDIAANFSISQSTIARYVRLGNLIPEFLALLDGSTESALPLRAGVSLSHLSVEEQRLVLTISQNIGAKITVVKADALKMESSLHTAPALDKEMITKILKGEPKKRNQVSLRFEQSFIDKYFSNDSSEKEIKREINAAMEYYRKNVKRE